MKIVRRSVVWLGLIAGVMVLSVSAQDMRASGPPSGTVPLPANAQASVCFSPGGCVQELFVAAIARARRQILVQAYGFSNHAIVRALLDAKARGVDVEVILDKSNLRESYSGLPDLYAASIPVFIDNRVRIAHNKVMILDGMDVVTGSANLTESAQKANSENAVYLQNVAPLAALYLKDWYWRRSLSTPYSPVRSGRY